MAHACQHQPTPLHHPSAGKLWRLKEAGLWNLEPTGYFEEGRYLSFTPPKVPHPLPPAAVEPHSECMARQQRGEVSATYDGWWAPSQPAPCVKPIPLYPDKNGDQGVTISEARTIAPRLQVHLAPRDSRTALHAARHATRTPHARRTPRCRRTLRWRRGTSWLCVTAWRRRGCSTGPLSFPCSNACVTALSGPTWCVLPPAASETPLHSHYSTRPTTSPHHPHHSPPLSTPLPSTPLHSTPLHSTPLHPAQVPTCRLENSDLEFPFGCPLNFLINVHFMQGIENGAKGRHGVPYREHSFLSNPRLAPRLRTSRASVRFSRERPATPAEAGNMVTLPRGATDRELLAALGPGSVHDDTAVLLLEDEP